MASDKEMRVDISIVHDDPRQQRRAYAYVCRQLSDTPQAREDGPPISDRQLVVEALGLGFLAP